MNKRISDINRKTRETDINVRLDIDGKGIADINTGIGFFDHLLESFCRFASIDLYCHAKGDLNVDCHHTVEDTGIVLGNALKDALGQKKGINRAGFFILPMDDALILTSIDLSGRSYLSFDCDFRSERIGELETETIREFFYALSSNAMMNIHIKAMDGINSHHIAEGMFKSFGLSLKNACQINNNEDGILSTKGCL